jgi:hypothetical protein
MIATGGVTRPAKSENVSAHTKPQQHVLGSTNGNAQIASAKIAMVESHAIQDVVAGCALIATRGA